jgi:hypothetical protein
MNQVLHFRYYGYATWLLLLLPTVVEMAVRLDPRMSLVVLPASLLTALLAIWRNRGTQRVLGLVALLPIWINLAGLAVALPFHLNPSR